MILAHHKYLNSQVKPDKGGFDPGKFGSTDAAARLNAFRVG